MVGPSTRVWRQPPIDRRGFTLIEILIVVLILGVLAAVAIPQFTNSTDDAKLSALSASRTEFRRTVELYYLQHSSTYPGAKHYSTGATTTTAAEAESSFVRQMSLYSASDGRTSTTKTTEYKYGPYLKTGVPTNPFNDSSRMKCDVTITDISCTTTDGTTGWIFYVKTGRLFGNDVISDLVETDVERDFDRRDGGQMTL